MTLAEEKWPFSSSEGSEQGGRIARKDVVGGEA